MIKKNVIRTVPTETQTKKGRVERRENVEKSFAVTNPEKLKGKHILLVDDVITTGATIEACDAKILKIEGAKLNVRLCSICNKIIFKIKLVLLQLNH